MKIITLVENTCGRDGCVCEHGLSVYIETARHSVLLDAGQTDAAVKNAKTLGVDLSKIDTVVLSHGHYDHSGGLLPFYGENKTAPIYMRKNAEQPHYNGEKYIGIDERLLELPTIKIIDRDTRLDDELFIFGSITGRRCYPQSNRRLSVKLGGVKMPDDFSHEQCLVIRENGVSVLLSGCAHNGILNILDRYSEIFGGCPQYVISGFHMMKRDGEYSDEESAVITDTAAELAKTDSVFYSGHCTGQPAFELMKPIMGDKLRAICTGFEINF